MGGPGAARRTSSNPIYTRRRGDAEGFARIDERHVELRPESHNPAHEVMKLNVAKHILHIEGVAVGALIGELLDAREEETEQNRARKTRTGRD